MTEIRSPKQYDLEDRTAKFAKECRDFVRKLPRNSANFEDGKQLIRSSGSQAANYIEANESLSKKDFAHRIKICRKEAKESCLWLELCDTQGLPELMKLAALLTKEAIELRKIFTSILNKSV